MNKKIRPRISFISLLLITVMFISFSGVQNVSATGTITGVHVYFDLDAYHYNVAYPEGYVFDNVKYGRPDFVKCEGDGYYSTGSETCNDNMMKSVGGSWVDRNNSTEYLSGDEQYCIYVNQIKARQGYCFPDCVKELDVYQLDKYAWSKDLDGFDVYVNDALDGDVLLSYEASSESIFMYIKLGNPSTKYVDPSMTIKGSKDPVEPTHTREFTTFYVAPFTDKSIKWSVSGNKSKKTTIVDGLLTIGSDETSDSVTIKATSVAEETVYDTLTIPVSHDIKPITSVKISPKEAEVYTGKYGFFSATVEGEQLNKSVNWTVSGATSADTIINENGSLYVGKDETAETLTVTCASVVFPDKKDTATVTVKQTKFLDKIEVSFDMADYMFVDGYGYTENDVNMKIKNGDPSFIKVTTEGCQSKEYGDGLYYYNNEYWNYVYEGEDVLTSEKDYAVYINEIVLDEGCEFPDSIKQSKVMSGDLDDFDFVVNGKVQDDVEIHYMSYSNSIYVYIPVGKPLIDLEKVTTLVEGITDKTYTGDPIEQDITVSVTKDEEKTVLTKDKDYVLSYENNVETGDATVTVKGIGGYIGTITKTFKIKPAPTVAPTKAATVSLKLNKTSTNIVCGKNETLKATLKGSTSKITWKSSDKSIATVDSNGKITAKMAGSVTITATVAGKTAKCNVTVLYKDVTDSKDFWFTPTNYLTAKGVVKGYDKQTTFKPENECSRAQMVTFLYRLQGEPKTKATTCKFTDVKEGEYYYKPVIWAVEKGITTGYSDGTFKPKNPCTRAQTVTFLWRMANKPNPQSKTCKFSDVKNSDYFFNAVIWAEEKKIVAGYSNSTFKPNDKCLRRQMVTFLYKYEKYINGKG